MKMHLALTLRVSTRMQNKRSSAQTDQRLCIYTALVSNVKRTCKCASVQVDQRVHLLQHPHPQKAANGKGGQRMI